MFRRLLALVIPVLLVLCFVNPASAQYYKQGKELMVRVLIRYNGPDTSPYLTHDAAKIALKEGAAARIAGILQSSGGKVGYSFRHINVVSGSIPASRLADLSNHPEIAEVTKDRIWNPTFDPFTATTEERKAWMKQKAQEIDARLKANPDLIKQKREQARANLGAGLANQQKKTADADAALKAPLRVSGTDSTIDPSQVNAILSSKGITPNNYLFYNHGNTNAAAVWKDGNQGDGIIVALIDSGTYSAHPLLSGVVIGGVVAPGLADIEAAADIDGDGVADGRTPSFDSILNNPHGTGTACMIAGHGSITMANNDRFLKAIKFHAPASVMDNGDGTSSVLLFGTAPKAKIYAIKVFSYAGGGSASSIILAGMEKAIDKKQDYLDGKPSGLNIQVVNMSLGGADLFQGYSTEDKLADSMVAVGIQPVISAGNAGPAPFTISEPGASLKAITVAAASERHHSRISWEVSFPELAVGDGAKMRLANESIPTQFSSHGPLPTGFGKPDLTAEGNDCLTAWLFDTDGDGLNDLADTAIVGGTSFSAPTTAGAVALLQSYAKLKGLPLSHQQPIKAALMAGARPLPGMDEDEVGKGFLDVKAAADYLSAHPDASAGPFNTRKLKFKGQPVGLIFPPNPYINGFYGFSNTLLPGQQDDFLIPMEQEPNNEVFYRFLYIYGLNKQRSQPFPAVVRDVFDALPGDGLGPVAALQNNTEIFWADGINTGFSDGDYVLGSLNQVDTYANDGTFTGGSLFSLPEYFPGLLQINNPVTDPFPSFPSYVPDPTLPWLPPITNRPSDYGSTLSSQNFGSGGRPDYDRLSVIGDNTNDTVSPVEVFFLLFDYKRAFFGLTLGTPSFTSSVTQNHFKEFNITLPATPDFYSFRMNFPYGWNSYKFPADPLFQGLTGIKRMAADVDMIVTAPDGSLLNESGFPGLFQGASLNDVEMIHGLANSPPGKYTIDVIGFAVKGVPGNTVPFEIRVWDGLVPIIP
jgi:subtilisin family serine protease